MFSLTASGTFADLITYENRADGQRVRRLPSYQAPQTALQLDVNTKVAAMAANWKDQTPTTHTAWKTRAADFSMTGYTLWWRESFSQHITPPATPTLP